MNAKEMATEIVDLTLFVTDRQGNVYEAEIGESGMRLLWSCLVNSMGKSVELIPAETINTQSEIQSL